MANAERTRSAYESDRRQWDKWAATTGRESTLPLTVGFIAEYVMDRGNTVRINTIRRHLSSMRFYHNLQRVVWPQHPLIDEACEEIERRQHDPHRRVLRFTSEDVERIIYAWRDEHGAKRTRDKALIVVGWNIGVEREALASINVGDIGNGDGRLTVQIRHGRDVGTRHVERRARLDPMVFLEPWLLHVGESGPLFRRVDRWGNVRPERVSGQAVSMVVKEAAVSIGADPKRYSGNSLLSIQPAVPMG